MDKGGNSERREEHERTKENESTPGYEPTGVGLDHRGANFPLTRWSVICSPDHTQGSATRKTLTELGSVYWYPLYAYLRRKGHSGHDAQDLTQGFFAELIRGDGLKGADASKGRFRSYLLGALNHYVSKVRTKASAQKRGGGQVPISIDQEMAEQRYQNEPADSETPESIYIRQWAMTLLQQVMGTLEQDYWGKGKGQLFETLKIYLTGDSERGTYGKAAEELETTEVNVRTAVKRMRQRYRDLLYQHVELLVNEDEAPEDEIRFLIKALA